MALTRDQVVQEMADRKLSPSHIEGVGWVVYRGGTRVRSEPSATPEAAVEAAVAEIAARELAAQERLARRIIEAQQRGDYYHRPRRAQRAVDGEVVEELVFDIVRTADRVVVVAGASSVVEAWRRLRDLLANGDRVAALERVR